MKLTITKRIERPVAAVFGVFTDLANAPKRIHGIKKLEVLTPGPVGVGTRFRETRIMFKREATEEMWITAFEPNRSYSVGGESCGCKFLTEFRFTPEGGGTRVDVEMRTLATTFFAKLMAPLGALMSGPMKKCFDQDLEDLKGALEKA